MHMRVITDDEFGAIAAAVDEDGRIVATASSGISECGHYTAVDEGTLYALTGQLLPMQAWEQCLLDETDEPA